MLDRKQSKQINNFLRKTKNGALSFSEESQINSHLLQGMKIESYEQSPVRPMSNLVKCNGQQNKRIITAVFPLRRSYKLSSRKKSIHIQYFL